MFPNRDCVRPEECGIELLPDICCGELLIMRARWLPTAAHQRFGSGMESESSVRGLSGSASALSIF
jgi:hypothetical protein